VLPAQSRLRRPDEFRDTLHEGVRCGRRSLVMHVRPNGRDDSRAGFIVSKAVGKAVTRNRVKRRLRHLAAASLPSSVGVDVVVRALPMAVAGDLREDFDSALRDCLGRLAS